MGSYRLLSLLFIFTSFSVIFLISSCEQTPEKSGSVKDTGHSQKQITKGGTYNAPLLNNPATLDPAYVQDQYGTAVVQQLFDGLVRFDPYLLVLPALAETWQVEENGRSYRFTLQKNAHFHNGDMVTAQDVVFSLSRLLRVSPTPAILPQLLKIEGAQEYRDHSTDVVAGLQAIDEQVVLIRLAEPHAPFLTALGMYQAKIVPKAEVLRLGDEEFGRKPVGSGAFKFVLWEQNKHIQLERFAEYFAGEALLDKVEYKIYPGGEVDQTLDDFRNGELDEMLVLGNIREELSAQKGLQWFHRPALSLMFYGLKVDHPRLNNPQFRRKLSEAIDRKKLLRDVYNDQFEPAENILPPGMPGVSQDNKPQPSLVSETEGKASEGLPAGRDEGPISLEIVSGSKSAFAQAELSFVRQAWLKLGIDLTIKYITDWSAFEAYINSDQVQVYRYAWFADMPDPDSFFYPLFASGSTANFMGFKDEEVNNLILSAREKSDPAERAEMYREIEALIMKYTPVIPLIYPSVDRVYKSYVQGAQPSALGADYMPLHRVWIKNGTQTQ